MHNTNQIIEDRVVVKKVSEGSTGSFPSCWLKDIVIEPVTPIFPMFVYFYDDVKIGGLLKFVLEVGGYKSLPISFRKWVRFNTGLFVWCFDGVNCTVSYIPDY